MVGDTAEDAEAAQANGVPFVFAAYGYGSYPSASRILARFSDLLDNQGIPT
jgi:phosphoglycolate phosphatase-like HAD superfamily hydrolase